MDRKDIVFCDVDGTLCFHARAHGVRKVAADRDGTVLVAAPDSERVHRAYDLSTGDYAVYMSVETRSLCLELRERFDLVLVTGGRRRTLEARRGVLDFAYAYVIESGGVILDHELRPHEGWAARIEPALGELHAEAARLRREGWRLDDEGRTAAIRVRRRDNPERTAREFDSLVERCSPEGALRATRNLGHVDFFPARAGKGNAVRFLVEQGGYPRESTIGIGDDLNDLDFLRVVGKRYLLGSSHPEALEEAKREGWTVSERPLFDGIHAILRAILER